MIADVHARSRIAVLDESRNFQNLMRTMLRYLGLREVETFGDPLRAAAHVAETPVDVAFVGLNLPGQDGPTWAHAARRRGLLANPNMAIVLVTAQSMHRVLERSIVAGIDDLLVKPLSPEVLGRHLSFLLARRSTYVVGPSGYFGPEIEVRLRRLDPRMRERLRDGRRPLAPAARPAAVGSSMPLRRALPGLDVEIVARTGYGGDTLFLD